MTLHKTTVYFLISTKILTMAYSHLLPSSLRAMFILIYDNGRKNADPNRIVIFFTTFSIDCVVKNTTCDECPDNEHER